MNSTKIYSPSYSIQNKRCIILPMNIILVALLSCIPSKTEAQINKASRSGFTWISSENVNDNSFGAGYTLYSAAWPTFGEYPGTPGFQMGLAGCWLTTQRTGNEPDQFYTTIEGGLGWWGDTRFGKETPKFIMGGVSHDFFAWANGPGAGRSNNLSNGQRDWSTPGGKYGVAQLSNALLWAPDGLNMAQGLNGELFGYGYSPLPLTDPMEQTAGVDIKTGNQCWTLFVNSTNFKGPATFFLPTFWTKPVLEDPTLEGLFLDSRPSNPNIGFGVEHAVSPAITAEDNDGTTYAKTTVMQLPPCGEDNSILMNGVSVYSQNALWNAMESWFNGGDVVDTEFNQMGVKEVSFINNGGSMVGEITPNGHSGPDLSIDLSFMDPIQQTSKTMGYEYDLNVVEKSDEHFLLPEYYRLDADNRWRAVKESEVPMSTELIDTPVPINPRSEITYLTPMESDCAWQDPNGPWNSPGPSAGPFTADLGDGSTVTYYWYKFVDQPAIIQANLPEAMRTKMQERVELIHANWSHTDEYLAPPPLGKLATIDPEAIVTPPAGMEIGYVPIVTRQEKTKSKLRVFVLAGQSNMQGHGTIDDPENDPGSLVDVVQNDTDGEWSAIGELDNWTTLENAYLYFERDQNTIQTKVTVGQGANSNLIGPELMFAHEMDEFYDDPILIIKTAWGGKSLAVDFRPPSAGGTTGTYYNSMITIVNDVTENLADKFPDLQENEIELTGFAWFQGWNDGASDAYLNEYESNLNHLIQDVRSDLNVPDLPFVIANSGHGGYAQSNDGWVRDMQEIVSVAQQNVGCDDTSYGGKVGFVDTKLFYKEREESPFDGIHHFHNNAETFLNIGKSIGKEMIKTINDRAFCTLGCDDELIEPDLTSIGNRVWNDYNRNGINDPNEPGIAGVSVVLWYDSDSDGIPDWQGFGGVQVTDEDGYYRFSGLLPGNYVTFVWSVNNWGPGEPLEEFVSTTGYVADANNDVDFDNNGSGNPFTDIFSGIVTLTVDGEPLNDGDPEDSLFDLDPAGNNTVDFGFYNPTTNDVDNDGFSNIEDCDDFNAAINPNQMEEPYNGIDDDCNPETLDDDLDQDGFSLAEDCDDANPDINPDQMEEPYNGIDEDCNPETLDDDLDQDGFLLAEDCDDANSDINPDKMEEPYNGIDEDCNPETLDDDLDQDGFLLAEDCDDANPDINPNAEEIANNGIDEDCNGNDLILSAHEISNVEIKIYPNPAIDIINIELLGQLDYQVSMYTMEGKRILLASNLTRINVDSFANGTYLLEIKDLKTGQKIIDRIVIGK
ncbi:MAG: sialate O-acetylesterase [Saprospiraceae bacterium]|nr:sialate O-acetylesterase [Saprospiraceae bacterium]